MSVTRQSLLLRARVGDESAWNDLVILYRPLLLAWLRRQDIPPSDVDDLLQEILIAVVRYLPSFRHSGHLGAFRSWLRTIACNRTADYWRSPGRRAIAPGGDASSVLRELEQPDSDLNRRWDEEHDRYVLRCLLDLVEQEFEPTTLQAFRRLALDEAPGAQVAAELGLSIGAVYVAKSRVLGRIREEAEGLID